MPDYETVIRKPESELLLGENDTPQVVPRTESDFPLISYESGMELPNSVFGDGEEFYVYNLIMNEADVISFCKKYDLSPNAFVAVFCVKTIGMLFLEPEKPIVCNINQNYGPELGYYNNRHDLVRPINIVYPIKIFEAPYSLLGTLTRGQMILKSSRDYCKQELIDNYNRIAVIDSLNSFAEKLEYARTHARKRDASGTVIISYPGKTELEPLNEYMLYIIPMVFHRFGIAIDAIAGTIRLLWHQKGKGGILINTFIENLKKEGIYVIIKDPLHLEAPVLSQEFTPM
jgi:hypothetical protein